MLHIYNKSYVSRVFVLHQQNIYKKPHGFCKNMLHLPCSYLNLEQDSSTWTDFYSYKMSVFFIPYSLDNQPSNLYIKFCHLYIFALINNHSPIRTLFLIPIVSWSYVDFKIVSKLLVITSNDGSSLEIFGITVLFSLCSEYLDLNIHLLNVNQLLILFFTS